MKSLDSGLRRNDGSDGFWAFYELIESQPGQKESGAQLWRLPMMPEKPGRQAVFAFLFLMTSIAAIAALGDQPLVLLGVCAGYLALGLYFWHTRVEIIRVIITAVIMTIAENVMCLHGVYAYSTPQLFQIPCWLPVGWAFFSLAIFRIIEGLASVLDIGYAPPKKPWGLWIAGELAFITLLFYVCTLFWENTALSLFATVATLFLAAFLYRGRMLLLIVLVSIIVATILEYTGIVYGVWHWNAPDLWGLPLWVPLAYAIVNLLTYRVSSGLCYRGQSGCEKKG
ncbi:MAG: hypothetical protein KKA60_12030 [Proteobacteria bacterium]|nr:hypothetical protein [Pseudomonadota bacterium]